jgi:hypothetical protein
MCGSSVNLKSHLAIPFNQSYMRSHLATSLNQNQKMLRNSVNLKSHLAIPFNQSYMRSHVATSFKPKQKIYGTNGLIVMGDLPRWKECGKRSHYDGWPTQMERIWSAVSL